MLLFKQVVFLQLAAATYLARVSLALAQLAVSHCAILVFVFFGRFPRLALLLNSFLSLHGIVAR